MRSTLALALVAGAAGAGGAVGMDAGYEWGYTENMTHIGPYDGGMTYVPPSCWGILEGNGACNGDAQSPINIADAKIQAATLPVLTTNYGSAGTGSELKNDGHGLKVTIKDDDAPSNLDIGGILGKHYPEQCEWGYFGNGMTRRRLEAAAASVEDSGPMLAKCYMQPSEWYKIPGNEACSGDYQSPINIVRSDVVRNANLPSLTATYNASDADHKFKLSNNGHTVELEYTASGSLDIGKILSLNFPDQCTWGYYGKGMFSDSSRRLEETTETRNLAGGSIGMDGNCYVPPDEWHKIPGNYKCNGTYQSPIDIVATEISDDSSNLPTLQASYDYCDGCTVTNNGHGIELDYNGNSSLNIGHIKEKNWGSDNDGGTLYSLSQLQFHWGKGDTEGGSEHTVGGKSFPLEMHMVHTQDGNDDAMTSKGGLAVFGVMFQIENDLEDYSPYEKRAYDEIEKLANTVDTHVHTGLPYIMGDYVKVEYFMTDTAKENYFTYKGSLTTPGCYESVNWIIAAKALKITSATLAKLRKAQMFSNGQLISANNRPVQALSGRSIFEKRSGVTSNFVALNTAAHVPDFSADNITFPNDGKINGAYSLSHLQFHWGEAGQTDKGSEHTVDGKSFPFEMHMVHTQDGNDDAMTTAGGLAILGVMFEIGTDTGTEIEKLANAVASDVHEPGSDFTMPAGFSVRNLLPAAFKTKYMTYRGSLTTPGCHESVNWIIPTEPMVISVESLNKFRKAQWFAAAGGVEAQVIVKNNRPVQPMTVAASLPDRVVYEKGTNSASLAAAASTPSAETKSSADISWPALKSAYKLSELQFRWGADNNEGSEHQVNGKAFPLELHFVHKQVDNSNAETSPGGLAVIGVMFIIDDAAPNTELDKMLSKRDEVKHIEEGHTYEKANLEELTLTNLLPDNFADNYFTYKGSLTTPGCHESVNWIVPIKPMTVSTAQMTALRELEMNDEIERTFRPVQYIGSRKVYQKGANAADHADIRTTNGATNFTELHDNACEVTKTLLPTKAPTYAPDTSQPVEWYESPGALVIIIITVGLAVFALVYDQMSLNKGTAKQVQPVVETAAGEEVPATAE
jgi:carbonic anhydrase